MEPKLQRKMEKLRSRIRNLDSALIAFSGGSDSSFLTRICREELGERAVAVTITKDYPKNDLDMAKSIAKIIGIKHLTVDDDIEQIAQGGTLIVGSNSDKKKKSKSRAINPLSELNITANDIMAFRKEKLGHYLDRKKINWKFRGKNVYILDQDLSKPTIRNIARRAKSLGFRNIFIQVS